MSLLLWVRIISLSVGINLWLPYLSPSIYVGMSPSICTFKSLHIWVQVPPSVGLSRYEFLHLYIPVPPSVGLSPSICGFKFLRRWIRIPPYVGSCPCICTFKSSYMWLWVQSSPSTCEFKSPPSVSLSDSIYGLEPLHLRGQVLPSMGSSPTIYGFKSLHIWVQFLPHLGSSPTICGFKSIWVPPSVGFRPTSFALSTLTFFLHLNKNYNIQSKDIDIQLHDCYWMSI